MPSQHSHNLQAAETIFFFFCIIVISNHFSYQSRFFDHVSVLMGILDWGSYLYIYTLWALIYVCQLSQVSTFLFTYVNNTLYLNLFIEFIEFIIMAKNISKQSSNPIYYIAMNIEFIFQVHYYAYYIKYHLHKNF